MEKILKIGKLGENSLKRSVLKQLHKRRAEVVVGAAVGEDCAAVKLEEGDLAVLSTDPITGALSDIGLLAVHITANDLACSGAEAIGLMVNLLMPEGSLESHVRSIMRQIDDECGKIGVEVIGGHTEVTDAVTRPLVSVTGVGRVRKDGFISSGGAGAGQSIVMTKWAGLEGSAILAADQREELQKRLPDALIDRAAGFSQYLSVVPESRIARDFGVSAMHDVTEGGIFGALWELAEASHKGLEVFLRDIPIRQETVEICNHLDINPYMLVSGGALLMTADDGEGLTEALMRAGINAAVIGHITEGNDRIIKNKDEVRYLDRPGADELYRAGKIGG